MSVSYDELLRQYNDLQRKYDILKAENAQLRLQISGHCTIPSESIEVNASLSEQGINRFSRPEEKIHLFRSLFRGREDVFARRWYSVKTEKSGYQPVCGNEWAEGLCDKKASCALTVMRSRGCLRIP